MTRTHRMLVALVFIGLFTLTITACGGTSTGSVGTPTGGIPPATSTPKAKPTGVPKVTTAFCQGLLSISDANSIMKPPTAATTIRIDTSPIGGSCNYEYASFKSVVSVNFLPYRGGSLSALASQLTATPGAKVTTTPVSGVGDQALFVAATLTSVSLRQDYLDVVDGAIVLQCFNPNVGSASDASQQAALTQVCQQVIARL
jgi:hypothetical protein